MAAPHNVEFEAAKFLQKLIQESTDEPARLATKLYVILQHMKASGKENSMPYQVISRAMETVINQHGLDIEALTSSRPPPSTGPQAESAITHAAGSSQTLPATDSKSGMTENDATRIDGYGSCRPPAAPTSLGHDLFQGSVSQRSGRSFDHESPSSIDTKSTNSLSQDRRETASWEHQGAQNHPKRVNVKRKKSDSSALESPDDTIPQIDSLNTVADLKKERLTSKAEMQGNLPGVSESWKQGFMGATNFRETAVPVHLLSPNQANVSMANFSSASHSDAPGRQMSADRLLQTANLSGVNEMGAQRGPASRDTGKAPAISNMPFKEHHLKQLRAQCLVFLAFRNGLAPKRLHLEVALGNIVTQEGLTGSVDATQNELLSDKGKQPTTLESSCTAAATLPRLDPGHANKEGAVIGTAPSGCGPEVDAILTETKSGKPAGAKMDVLDDSSYIDRSGMITPAVRSNEASLMPGSGTNHGDHALGTNKPLKPEMTRWTGVAQNDFSRSPLLASIPHELGNRKDGSSDVPQHEGGILNLQRTENHMSTSLKAGQGAEDVSKMVPVFDSSHIHTSPSPLGSEPEEEDKSVSAGLASSPKLTLSEKWIVPHQKRRLANEQKWALKLQKTDQRIACRFSELKETVSSSEDISAKTKSVIELKKLQLLELQRRLRRNIINDFFKPVQSEMDQLKSIKKHRIGRRMKHVEKYEQKMKEERQKRIRERQKEFFSEVEVHKERLEDLFKFKRERCKAFNRHVKEFHKRKERIYREKIDKIQREKINLLKINDVEGYLRMVKDAKSDRVKQLLKETEKYLQKLGSKLQEAKTSAREAEIDENRIATFDESSENAAETEDEKDQAKHYKESNEKYYLIAHSIKESITEQPAGIQGGKLREYQMNGLRWLVSLYNNHLNGILADEMGLGKTVQVISLLCYLMEAKNDRGPFLVVVPSSVLPGWEREMSFWAPGINKIIYTGPPEERRRLFKESIVHQKFNVLLTTYEYLMNKHDRPKLSKIHWHYVIIDEGHRIKNASCKLNAELKHYHSSHRLLLTGTPLQNSLEELWALLNFLLPNIFNSSEDFSQWFNKPFEGSGDNSLDEALLSEEENLLIINRLHQVLRPFVLRRLKHKVENELPEKIERLIRCEASAYQKLLMTRVEENLGSLGATKGRAIHNSVMELRNICNHPYLSQLHVEEVDSLIPKHFLPPIIRLCGKLEMLDRLLPKLKETNHRVLFFSTMTRLLDVMEDYLVWKQYRYLRLDGHTSGQDRGALIEKFNQPDSPFFIFLLSIRAGGVGVNLQAADTVIIFDTDWNPQVDLQAQARAHRIGQKKDVLVLRLETVKSVEEQVRAAAEHKLGVANQSITAGFFDNNTSAEDRREYLESLLRESKKEEAAPVLDDDSLNDILARSEPEIEVFEAIDQKRREEEMATWKTLFLEHGGDGSEALPPLPSRLVTDDDLKAFYEAMKVHEAPSDGTASSSGVKRKGGYIGGFDSQQYGRGKRAREVRSYEEQWSEEEFEKMCQSEFPRNVVLKDEKVDMPQSSETAQIAVKVEIPVRSLQPPPPSLEPSSLVKKEDTSSARRGRGRPKRTPTNASPSVGELGTATIKRRGRKPSCALPPVHFGLPIQDPVSGEQLKGPSSDTRVSLNSGGKVISGDSSADCSHESLPKRSESSDTLTLKDTKALELAAENNSFVKSLKAATSPTRDVTVKNDAPSHSRNAPVQNLMGVKLHEQSVKHATSDLSAANSEEANKVDVVHQGQVLPIFKSSGGSAAVSTSGGTPLIKDDSHIDNPKPSSEAMPSSITRTGRKQTQKPQNAGEPVRRRGRKRGPTVLADSIPLVVQDQNSHKPLKTSTTSVTYVVPTTDASPVNVAVIPLVPVSNFATGSADVTAVSGSMRRGSKGSIPRETTVDLQAKGQAQREKCTEIAPRRRGRKKSTVSPAGLDHSVGQYSFSRQPDGKDDDFAERKGIATRSRQVNVSQSESTLGDMHSLSTFALSASKDSMATVSYTSPDIPKPCIGESASIVAETRHTSAADDMKKFARPSDFPPISSKGKTNVIVLALDVPSLDVDPVGMGGINSHEKKEFPNLQIESTASASKLNVELSGFNATHATRTEVATLDEELSAPPGFETSRPCVSNAATTKSGEQSDCRISNSPDAKIGPVVLALRSSPQTSVPSIKCHNISEKEKTLEVKSFKVSGHETVVPLPPEGRTATPEAATDEDLLAPPGFDIPQQRLLESEAVKTPACDESDLLAASAVKVRSEEDYPVTSGQDTHDTGDALRTSIAVGSTNAAASTVDSEKGKNCLTPIIDDVGLGTIDASLAVRIVDSDTVAAVTLKSEEKGDILGPRSTEHNLVDASTASVTGPVIAAVTTIESKGLEKSYAPIINDVGLGTTDAPLAVRVVDSETVAAVTLKSEEKGDILGPGCTEQNLVDASTASVAVPCTAAVTTLESKGHEESYDKTEQNVVDASTASFEGPYIGVISPLESKAQEESRGPDHSKLGLHTSDASLAVSMVDSDVTAALSFKIKQKTANLGRDSTDENVVDGAATSGADFKYAAASVLGLKEQKESHGPDCSIIEHKIVCASDSDTAAILTSGLEEKGEHLGSGDSEQTVVASDGSGPSDGPSHGPESTRQNVIGASSAFFDGLQNATTSVLELKEQEESHGPENGDTGNDTRDASLAVGVVDCNTEAALNLESKDIGQLGSCSAAISALELKEQEKSGGPDSDYIGHDTSDVPLPVGDSVTSAALTLELIVNGDNHGIDSSEQNPVDASAASVAGSDIATTSAFESQGSDCDKTGHVLSDAPLAVSIVGSDIASALNCDSKGKIDLLGSDTTEQNVVDASAASIDSPHLVKTSAVELKEQEKTQGCDGGDVGQDTSDALLAVCVVDPNTASALAMELKGKELLGSGNMEPNVVDAFSAYEAGPCNAASTLESSEQEKSHGLDDCNVQCDAAGSPSSVMAGSDATEALNPEPQIGKLFHALDGDLNTGTSSDLNVTDAVLAMGLKEEEITHGSGGDLKVTDAVSAMELKEEEKTHGLDGDLNTGTNSDLSVTDAASAMKLKEEEITHGSGGDLKVTDAVSAVELKEEEKTHVSGGDLNIGSGGDHDVTDAVLAMELKEEEKTHGFRDDLSVTDAVSAMELKEGETTHGAGGDLSIGTGGDHNATDGVSTMESKEEEQTHGGDLNVGSGDLNVTEIVSARELKEEEKTQGASGSDLHIGSGGDLKVTDAVSAVELKGEEKTHGAGGDLEVTGVVSAMESKEEEKTPGPNDGKAEDNADDNPTTSHDASVDTVVETTSEQTEKND